jgi:hypothetical protein
VEVAPFSRRATEQADVGVGIGGIKEWTNSAESRNQIAKARAQNQRYALRSNTINHTPRKAH